MDDKRDNSKVYGEVCVRRQRRKRQKVLIIELLLDYAKNSTLHGLRYIAERGLSIIEKLFWLLTFAISFGLCFYLIRNVYIKWKTSPVIVSFSEHIVPVGKVGFLEVSTASFTKMSWSLKPSDIVVVPFPSVTICPQIKSMTSKYNFSAEYVKALEMARNDTFAGDDDETIAKLENVALICDQGDFPEFSKRNASNSSIINHLYEVSPHVGEVFEFCFWRNFYIPCEDMFKPVLTAEGYCFNFNALAANEILNINRVQREYIYLGTETPSRNWTLLDGYLDYDPNSYPKRGRENGASPDLHVILIEENHDRDGLCNSLQRGYKIYVQHPADFPQSSLYYYAAIPKQVSSLALKFNMLTTADSLQNYSPEVRQCYFPWDRPLRYFQIYTPNNCRLECQSNYTFKQCGCVWFHMPHVDSRAICTIKSKECVVNALDKLALEELKADESELGNSACKCYPDCHSVKYDAEILKTEFDFRTYLKAFEKLYHANFSYKADAEFSSIQVYFKEPRFVSMRRSELFGLTDFMANCGGLLGLFLGFSFLSLVEVFYFISLRLFCTLKRDLKEEKASRDKNT